MNGKIIKHVHVHTLNSTFICINVFSNIVGRNLAEILATFVPKFISKNGNVLFGNIMGNF